MLFDQTSRQLEIRGCQRMLYRFDKHLLLLVPGTGTTMQLGYQARLRLLQVAGEHLGKQRMIAVPVPLVVERVHEEVRVVECFQHRLAPFLTGHGVAEWSAEAFKDRGV